MIKNEKQYLTTKKQIKNFKTALEQSKKSKDKVEAILYNAMIQGIQSQIYDLENEINEYDKAKYNYNEFSRYSFSFDKTQNF